VTLSRRRVLYVCETLLGKDMADRINWFLAESLEKDSAPFFLEASYSSVSVRSLSEARLRINK